MVMFSPQRSGSGGRQVVCDVRVQGKENNGE